MNVQNTSYRQIIPAQMETFRGWLLESERSPATVEKYLRDLRAFLRWLGGKPVAKESVMAWRADLLESGHTPVTVNGMLASLHAFFQFAGWPECRVRYLRIQRRMFRDSSRELTREEYLRLVAAARNQGRERLALLLETMAATGIRVSEVRYITKEAAQRGRSVIQAKGKLRTILLPEKLCRKLLKYAKKKKIASGKIFLTRSGGALSRKQIWAEMKSLCRQAGVKPSRVFPHNLRHLFATAFYRVCKDIVRLADVLGHSSIETTRIYLLTTGAEHARWLECLHMVS